jgi:2-polyprenyl-6-methoxyphenol hydroxylase-like FAD-dependent oxidoreductase
VRDSALMRERMVSAVRVSAVYSTGDYSYRNTHLTGDRWMLAGDAAGFIDPIFSTGVFLALHSGEQCADALDEILARPARRPCLFRRYERGLHALMDQYLRFATAWYRPEFIEVFTMPAQHLQLTAAVNSVLAGNIGNSFPIWWRMQVFYIVLFLQRYMALCPRLDAKAIATPQLESAASR